MATIEASCVLLVPELPELANIPFFTIIHIFSLWDQDK